MVSGEEHVIEGTFCQDKWVFHKPAVASVTKQHSKDD